MLTVDQMIADIIRREGKLNDVKGDKGGITNLGVSLRYLKGVGLVRGDFNHDGVIDAKDIMLVDPPKAAALFKEDFFFVPHIDRLPGELHPIAFDMAVNHGAGRSVILVQKALGKVLKRFVEADGAIGPATVRAAQEALQTLGFKTVEDAVVDAREAYYTAIVAADPTQVKFRDGWMHRAEEFRV